MILARLRGQIKMSQDETLLLEITSKYGIDSVELFFEYVDKLKYSKEIELGFIKIADILPDCVIIANEDGIIQYANESALNEFQCGDLSGQHITILMPERYREDHKKKFKNATKSTYDNKITYFYACRSNGEEFPVSISSVKYRKNGQYNHIAIIRNLESEHFKVNLIKDIFNDLPVMMIVINGEEIEFVNREFSSVTGCNASDLEITNSLDDINQIVTWSNLNIKCNEPCNNITNSTWRVISLGNKHICIGPSKPEMLLRGAIEAIIEAKQWTNN